MTEKAGCAWQTETILAQAGNRTDDEKTGSISTPLYLSTAFRHRGLGQSTGYDYSRLETPTREVLEQTLAELEHGDQGFALSSGMAAIQLVFTLFKSGDHIITSDDLYGGSFRFFDLLQENYGLEFSLWDGHDAAELAGLVTEKTKAIWLETPSNPTMKVIDIASAATAAHEINPDIRVIVDNTFYTPLRQQPLPLGADIVVHSATKYLAGHNDVLAGIVVTKRPADSEQIAFNLVTTGATLAPFDSWLLIRSLKTLAVRLERHEYNARILVDYLNKNAAVEKVLYPGQGGMISFYLKADHDVDNFLQKIKLFSFAESLGGSESLITVPAVQTHHDMTAARREQLGITDQLLRLSTGLENVADLIADLEQALG
ncbi:methionine biosynthesis PLP-dependent protein [Periweissella cryptocerci]|uniref:Methionine biosynthesis PLP-dependent protein n=1 Tax=Periweissella cryptocerci TaxID=2506420 RepID=A0A4P6YT00_9LACO|nr:PLP-dependent transferase [Periweissella cryptocerci]QBO35801.1 methionine biosynthesis PLP-dependent protein [Periweissella cryptocerci]